MRYKIYVLEDNKWTGREGYSTKLKAEQKISKSYKRKRTKIIKLPDKIIIGLKLYSKKGKICGSLIPDEDEYLYGTIIDEDELYYYINRSFKDKTDRAFFHKDDFENKFLSEIFFIKEE